MATNTAAIQALYVAYFNRPADAAGLTYWDTVITNAKGSTAAVSAAFAASAEYKATYAGQDAYHVVATVYQNLFGHQPDTAGLNFWGQALLTGKMTVDNVVTQIAAGAQGTDLKAYQDKIAAATSFTAALDNSAKQLAYSGDAPNAVAKAWMATVTDDASLAAAIDPTALANTIQTIIVASIPVVNTSLTTGLDNLTGGPGNDVYNALIGTAGAAGDTLTTLDSINGAGGNNTLNITDMGIAAAGGTALPNGLTISNVQTVNVTAAQGANIDTSSGFTGLTSVNVVRSNGADTVKVGAGTAVNVTDTAAGGTVTVTAKDSAVTVNANGAVTVTGGSTQTVNTAGGVTLNKASGAINVVDTAQGNANSVINDGTNVSLTATTSGTGSITIGNSAGASPAAHTPTGTVTVVQNLNGTGASLTGGNITVTGGTVDTITVNATQDTAAATTTVGTVAVNGTAATTSVSVTQTAAVAPVTAVTAVAGVKLVDAVTFTALTAAGQSVTVGGLTFTSAGAMTAAQVAAAFAGLSAGATQGASTMGTYSGALAGFSSGAASTASVSFTASSASGSSTDISATGATVVQSNAGVTAVSAVAGVAGIANGAVNVVDASYGTTVGNTITSVTENGYASGSVSSNALTSLSLANSSGQTVTVNNNAATTLGLTVNKLGTNSAVNLDAASAKYTALNITTTGSDSKVKVTGTAVTALSVTGSKAVDLSGSTFSALKTVTASGAAGMTLASVATVTDINASASTGSITVTNFDASAATYEGSAGTDTLTLASATVSKAISLGAGNDTITLAAGTSTLGAVIDGGAGTDTLSMTAADAVTASLSPVFASKAINFEVLQLTGGTGAQTVHVDVLGSYNAVTTGGEAAAGVLTVDGFTSGGTLTLNSATAGGSYVVSSAAFATPTNDVFNIAVSNASGINAGTVTVNSVEALNLTSTDTNTKHSAGTNTNTLTLSADSVTAVKVSGNANLVLNGANTTVTSVDASSLNGGLTYTTAGGVAEVVKGGSMGNMLTAAAGTIGDTLIGGAGNDTIVANGGSDTLTGNGGNDTFVFSTATANVNTYSTITDASVGDKIVLKDAGAELFNSTKVTLAATAVFQDYANAVVAAGGTAGSTGYIGWFQFNGDTYVVESLHNGATVGGTPSFVNGTDMIVKLTGLVDLSHTSINNGGAPVLLIG